MTAKRKITDKNGVQVFPITHTKAVIDDNGNSVEQRLQEQMDVINQKQLEVGAVPSDLTPTAGSTNWVTSGGVFDATNLVFDFNFDKYLTYYVNSTNNTIVQNSNQKAVEIENDAYYKAFLFGAKFDDTVPYAISFFSGAPSDDTFISGIQSTGKTVADYEADVPSNCKYIVFGSNRTVSPTARLYKKVTSLDSQMKNVKVKKQMTDFASIELINNNTNSTSEKQDGAIIISYTGTSARSGFSFGNVLEAGKNYVLEFDFSTDADVIQFLCRFANELKNALFSKYIINGAHSKLLFTAVNDLSAVWFSSPGTDTTITLQNIELYEEMSLTEYSLYIKSLNDDIDNVDAKIPENLSNTINGLNNAVEQLEQEINSLPIETDDANKYKYEYKGDRILIGRGFWFEDIVDTDIAGQSGAYYKGYYFMFGSNGGVRVYDVEEKTLVYQDAFFLPNYHCNNTQFGNEKYDDSDYFPLLYVSGEKITTHSAKVFRVIKDGTNFSLTLVQTIVYPEPTDNLYPYYPNCFIDKERSKFYVEGYCINSYSNAENNGLMLLEYNLPKLSAGETVNLGNPISRVVGDFRATTQGGFIKDGKIYQLFFSTPNFTVRSISDLSLLSYFSFSDFGESYEPEGLDYYEGNAVITNGGNHKVRIFHFK